MYTDKAVTTCTYVQQLQVAGTGELVIIHVYSCTGEQGCCSGESTYLPPLWPGFESSVNAIQCMGVEVVVGSFHFSPLLQAKNSKIKFQFHLEHMRSN